MKEAGNINASLMHLGKCLDAIKWNQQQKKGRNQRLIPYRDSKLTRIFKNYFEGKGTGSIRMVRLKKLHREKCTGKNAL